MSKSFYSINGNYEDVMQIMTDIARQQAQTDLFTNIVIHANITPDVYGLIRFCQFIRKNCPYVPHIGRQEVRTINAMLTDQRGNCVEYTTALCSLCIYMGWPVVIRAVSFGQPNEITHVFPLIYGIPVDLNIGQENDEKTDQAEIFLGETKNYAHYCDLQIL